MVASPMIFFLPNSWDAEGRAHDGRYRKRGIRRVGSPNEAESRRHSTRLIGGPMVALFIKAILGGLER